MTISAAMASANEPVTIGVVVLSVQNMAVAARRAAGSKARPLGSFRAISNSANTYQYGFSGSKRQILHGKYDNPEAGDLL
jgi:hypothetical protein